MHILHFTSMNKANEKNNKHANIRVLAKTNFWYMFWNQIRFTLINHINWIIKKNHVPNLFYPSRDFQEDAYHLVFYNHPHLAPVSLLSPLCQDTGLLSVSPGFLYLILLLFEIPLVSPPLFNHSSQFKYHHLREITLGISSLLIFSISVPFLLP